MANSIHVSFQFTSFITGNHRYIPTPQIGEDLTTARELDRPCYDEWAVHILNNNDRIVGHLPPQISKQCALLLQSGGTVMVKVTANPVDTKTHGIRIPCTYIISGPASFVQDIQDHIKDTITDTIKDHVATEQKEFARQWSVDRDGYDVCSECYGKCTYGVLPKQEQGCACPHPDYW